MTDRPGTLKSSLLYCFQLPSSVQTDVDGS